LKLEKMLLLAILDQHLSPKNLTLLPRKEVHNAAAMKPVTMNSTGRTKH
jgi:hypothetical protein